MSLRGTGGKNKSSGVLPTEKLQRCSYRFAPYVAAAVVLQNALNLYGLVKRNAEGRLHKPGDTWIKASFGVILTHGRSSVGSGHLQMH